MTPSEKIHKMISGRIIKINEEISLIDSLVEKDIDELLMIHPQSTEKEKFKERHFSSLKQQKLSSLQAVLDDLKKLEETFLTECRDCPLPNCIG